MAVECLQPAGKNDGAFFVKTLNLKDFYLEG